MTYTKTLVTLLMVSSFLWNVIGKENGLLKSKSEKNLPEKDSKKAEDLEDSCFVVLEHEQECPDQTCVEDEMTWKNGESSVGNFNGMNMFNNKLIMTVSMVLMVLW
jgi:hypothetical protein